MDAIEDQEHQAEVFIENDLILIHCVDTSYVFNLTIPSLPFLSISVIYCHFSFENLPYERRLLVIPNTHLHKYKLQNSPCLARVERSVLFECNPAEVVDEDRTVLLCWELTLLEDTRITAVPPRNPDQEELDFAPRLNLESVQCNCSKFPNTGLILFTDNTVHSDGGTHQPDGIDDNDYDNRDRSDEDDILEEDWEDELDEEGITHTLPFKCIGAAHERERQMSLEIAENALQHGQNVKARLRPEPTNEGDKDAIGLDIDYGTGWIHVGYIARELTKYIHPLLEENKILSVVIKHIKFRVHFEKMGFYPKVLITRQGAWESFVVRKSVSVQ